jgi:hypothetical protein
MAMEITGKVLQVLQPVTGEGKNGAWKKQEFIIETMDQYPKKVILQAWGDKAAVVQNLTPGTEVKVSFNPESREYNGRWYTDLRAWRIDVGTAAMANSGSNMPPNREYDGPTTPPPVEFKDDLPF